ncbi:hypothetical protein ACHAWF_016969 [Thalassiosira exigua]
MDDDDDDSDELGLRPPVAARPRGGRVATTTTLHDRMPSIARERCSPSAAPTTPPVSLLPQENKVSVMHAGLSCSAKSEHDPEVPVKSKDRNDKHKFERFMPLQSRAFFAGSVSEPTTYAPCSTLVFREGSDEGAGDDGRSGKRGSWRTGCRRWARTRTGSC